MAQKKHIIFNGRSISIKTLHKGGFEKDAFEFMKKAPKSQALAQKNDF